MRAALALCDERYPAALLCTAQPELYEPFGFRAVDEHKVVDGAAPRLDRRPVRRVELFACPDALGMAATAEPHVFVDGDDAIAARALRGSWCEGPLRKGC